MTPLRFGIIGVGNIARVHATAIKNSGAELVAVATRNTERGQVFVAEHGGAWYADYRDLLNRDDVDAVAICTPHDLHAPMTIDAAAARKHVLVEKPMAISTDECNAMIDACKNANVTLSVVFQMRFETLSHKLKALIQDGKLGRLLWVSTTAIWYRTDAYYRSAPWRGTWAHEGGGVLINQAVHVIDLMLYLSAPEMPTRVTAQMETLNHQIEVEDGAVAILEYADHRLGVIQATTAAFPGYPERLEFHGTLGSAVYHKGQGKLEWHIAEPRQDEVDQAPVSSGAAQPVDNDATGHTMQYQDFIDAVRNHRVPLVDGSEARKSIQLIQAIYRSAREKKSVDLIDSV